MEGSSDANNPPVQTPIIILDAYRICQMGSVVNIIQSMGFDVIHIPAGCTSLCQPIYVGINTPIKCQLREMWVNWMMEGDGIVNGMAKEPYHKMAAEWLVEVYKNISKEIWWNEWKKK
jgi:hypothetical protein